MHDKIGLLGKHKKILETKIQVLEKLNDID